MTVMLRGDEVAQLLARRGLVPNGSTARELTGGVSGIVHLVGSSDRWVVSKQALARLRVDADWEAPIGRLEIETLALQVAAGSDPLSVPGVLWAEPGSNLLVMEAAPTAWQPWKADLLAGRFDPAVGRWLGRTLGRLHTHTRNTASLADPLHDGSCFEQLRISPYYRTVAAVRPELRSSIEELIAAMGERADCLVHGDFSPKNVLVRNGRGWVLDWEVAHVGDPTFDLAFLLSHLVLKAVHLGDSPPLAAVARAFCEDYERERPLTSEEWNRIGRHLGALLVARVHGKSPVEYLNLAGRNTAASIGSRLLTGRGATVDLAWDLAGQSRAVRPV